jgi:hypothetical protein
MDNQLNELKRRLSLRKKKYKSELEYVVDMFGIDAEEYLNEYDELTDEVIECGVQLVKTQQKMGDLDMKYEKIKKSLLLKENINIREKISEFSNHNEKKKIVEMLFHNGFISTDESNILNEDIWNNRYKPQYGD